jgi:hypothetical protein
VVDVPFQTILNTEWNNGVEFIWVLYDSACRFKVNAHERCISNPHTPLDKHLHHRLVPGAGFIDYKVNAFHQHSHKPECADAHSIRNTSEIGMVTGEEIETGWAKLNHLQYSIREMDSGARIDMITAHMLNMNQDKIDRMGQDIKLMLLINY